MKVLFLTKYSDMGASSRYRTLQYLPYFESMGISCTHHPLFGENYLTSLYQKKRRGLIAILKLVFNRMIFLFFHARNYDLIVIEKEIIPYFPAIFEQYLVFRKVHFIIDYDDAIFHNYDESKYTLIRKLLNNKIPDVIKKSSGVIAGNNYILEYVKCFRSDNVHFLPTVINTNNYTIKRWNSDENFIVGWIGSPTTSKNILMLNGPLQKFCDKYSASVNLVGFDKELTSELRFPHEIIPWVQNKESDEIQKFSVGIMPLIDSPFNRGKCGLKLIQYHGCALPVIASPVGINKKIVVHAANGFLAKTDDDWYKHLEVLYNDRSLSRKMGEHGRKIIENEYSLSKTNVEYFNLISSFAYAK